MSVTREDIIKTYPKLFPSKYGYPNVDNGWLPLIDKFCKTIQNYVDFNNLKQPVFTTIKSKFGGLRLHLENHNNVIKHLSIEYERMSYRICESCGTTENVGRTDRWAITCCEKCYNDKLKDKFQNGIVVEQNLNMVSKAKFVNGW